MGRAQFIPFIVIIFGIVFTDLLVSLGLVVAIFHILWYKYKTPYHLDSGKHVPRKPGKIELAEDVSFLNNANILRTLNQLPDNTAVHIDASKARSIHSDILEIIDDFKQNTKTRDIEVVMGEQDDKNTPYDPLSPFTKIVAAESNNKKPYHFIPMGSNTI